MQFKNLLLCCAVVFFGISKLWSQKPYFQQKVDYEINLRLDDKKNQYAGSISMLYHNQSPDTLHFIYIHLWPNAYKNNRTAFSNQFTENGDRSFYFSKKEERGGIDSLNFNIDGQTVKWHFYGDQPDIAKLELPAALAPGDKMRIHTPFRVQIPKSVSRLGHVDESYQITQWYPKPAVYDRDGWHPMPYLDQGEFYSEFGSFDVKISLPKNYLVAATGVLQNAEEWDFINKRITFSEKQNFDQLTFEDNKIPASDSTFKTLHFKADSVHDFAWFADKRFYILKEKAKLASGREIDTYCYFTNEEANLWKRSPRYIARAIEFYSKTVGEYPYPHATAVQSALGAGGGMEYPMVTVIGLSYTFHALDIVITHEIGHNWFYGILANNERDDAWMDEGFNSYIESRYNDTYYISDENRTNYLAYLLQARQGIEQASRTPSSKQTNINYFLGAYSKPTLTLRYLEQYLGTKNMDKILQKYFEEWKFKHPLPTDLQALFERESGKNLDWVFKDLLGSTKQLNYGIQKAVAKDGNLLLSIKNKGEIAAPFSISLVNAEDSVLQTFWFEGLAANKDTTLSFPLEKRALYRLDASQEMPDINFNDNVSRGRGLFKVGIRPRFRFLFSTSNPEYPFINFAPVLGFNTHDGFMLGMAFYNTPIPARKWEYSLAPMFGFSAKAPIGRAELHRRFYPKTGKLQNWSLGIAAKSFNGFDNDFYNYRLRYARFSPNTEFNFRKKEPRAYQSHQLRIDNHILLTEKEVFERPDTVIIFAGKRNLWRSTHRVTHTFKNEHPITPFSIRSQAEYANYLDTGRDSTRHYLKLSVEGNFKFYYANKKAIDLRIYAAGFPLHTQRNFGAFPLHLASRNNNDYQFDEFVLGRREQGAFWSQQVNMREGGFKTPIDIAQSVADGRSNSFIMAINLKTDLPIKLPFGIEIVKIKPYLDLGFFKNTAPSVTINSFSEQLFLNGGLMIDIWDGAAGIYFPLFSSQNLSLLLKQRGTYANRISFSFNLSRFQPKELVNAVISGLY